MYKNLTIISVLGVLTIVLGAFGAHSLKEKLTPEAMQSFETAVRYQMYHVIVLLVINLHQNFSLKFKNKITYSFLVGILLFSGSIYLMYLANIPAKTIWFLTPLGGVVLIFGWVFMVLEFIKKAKSQ